MSRKTGHIYAYTTPAYRRTRWRGRRWGFGLIKVGYTTRAPEVRIREQIGASSPEKKPYTLLITARAKASSGKRFTDKDVHRELRLMGARNVHNEWFEARPKDVRRALYKLNMRPVKARQGYAAFMGAVTVMTFVLFIGLAFMPAEFFRLLKEILFYVAKTSNLI